MRRLAFLGVGSAVILSFGVISAAPAFADNGPHVATTGQFNVDRCAGCHRAHTGSFENLLTQDPTLLCQSCHGTASTGATTDVIEGIGFNALSGNALQRDPNSVAGALRAGGFTTAAINGASGAWSTTSSSTAIKSVSAFPLSGTGAGVAQTTTSSHKINTAGTMWGSGALGDATAGATGVKLECTSCHDPHGNGNFRILKPTISTDPNTGIVAANGGWAFAKGQAATLTSVPAGVVGSRGTTYTITATVVDGTKFRLRDPATFYATTGTNGFVAGTITDITGNTLTISYTLSSGMPTGWPTAPATSDTGILGYADPAGIASTSINGSVVTYKTWNLHGLYTGAKVTMAGFVGSGATANNVTRAAVAVANDPLSFTIDFSAQTPALTAPTATATTNGTISGIPDAASKVYVTTNYWAADDHNYTGTLLNSATTALSATATAANKGPTAFISNISQWCTQCHTRLLAGSGAYATDSGDPMYTFRHRSQSPKENSPNCIQCHVAHGSNVSMGTYSSAVGTEISGTSGDSFLLRVDSRGTCQMCHNK